MYAIKASLLIQSSFPNMIKDAMFHQLITHRAFWHERLSYGGQQRENASSREGVKARPTYSTHPLVFQACRSVHHYHIVAHRATSLNPMGPYANYLIKNDIYGTHVPSSYLCQEGSETQRRLGGKNVSPMRFTSG